MSLLAAVIQADKPLPTAAKGVEGEALAKLIVNRLRETLKVADDGRPGFGDRRKTILEDLAILTGGQRVLTDLGTTLATKTSDMLGTAKAVASPGDNTAIIARAGKVAAISSRIAKIRIRIAETTPDDDTDKLPERLAGLPGGAAAVKVGGGAKLVHAGTRLYRSEGRKLRPGCGE